MIYAYSLVFKLLYYLANTIDFSAFFMDFFDLAKESFILYSPFAFRAFFPCIVTTSGNFEYFA